MWHFGGRMHDKESEDRKNISLKEIHVPKQLLTREIIMFVCL